MIYKGISSNISHDPVPVPSPTISTAEEQRPSIGLCENLRGSLWRCRTFLDLVPVEMLLPLAEVGGNVGNKVRTQKTGRTLDNICLLLLLQVGTGYSRAGSSSKNSSGVVITLKNGGETRC